MTHSLNYEECDIMHAIYQKNTLNRWVATPKLIREWLNYFYHRLEEISMICSDGVIKFKSYIDDTTTKEGKMYYLLYYIIYLYAVINNINNNYVKNKTNKQTN